MNALQRRTHDGGSSPRARAARVGGGTIHRDAQSTRIALMLLQVMGNTLRAFC